MKKEQRNLSTGALALVVIGLLTAALIGWYVVSGSQKDQEGKNNTVLQRNDVTPDSQHASYKNTVYDFSFVYPNTWQDVTKQNLGDVVDTNAAFIIQAPETKKEVFPQVGESLRSGSVIGVNVSTIQPVTAPNAQQAIQQSEVTIDGITASKKVYKYNPYADVRAGFDEYLTTISFEAGDKFVSSSKQLTKGTRFFSISMRTVDNPDSSAYRAVLEGVINSFRIGKTE